MHHQTSSTDLHSIEAVGEALSAADQVADPLDNAAVAIPSLPQNRKSLHMLGGT